MILLHPSTDCPKTTVVVNLKDGVAPEQFAKDAKFSPNAKGYDVYVDTNEFKWYQKAARTVSSLCLKNFCLTSDKALTQDEFYWFITALYDGKTDYDIFCDFDADKCFEVQSLVSCVSKFRQIADSDSKSSTPVSVVLQLFETIKAYVQDQGSLTLKLCKRGDSDFKKYAGLYTVGMASTQDPCMGIIDYIPNTKRSNDPLDIALVGKGITFDTGGYSLKPDKYMETMRTDKTAVVYLCGALAVALLKGGLDKRVRLYLCCSENMVSGHGMLPGDIIAYPNGITVEINNTDAEGRLVLADGLLQASEDKAQYILDMATLTGAAKIAVGRDMCSVLTKEKVLDPALTKAFDEQGEMYWQLPLAPYHRRFLSSRRATVTNSGHGEGAPGSSVAASFLEQFVPKDTPWVHIDLSSAYLPDGSPFLAAGPTGATILGIASFLLNK